MNLIVICLNEGIIMNYFQKCIGKEYNPVKYGKHEARHPIRVKEALETLKGTKEADVIVALVFEIEILRQRSERFAEELMAHDQTPEPATKGL